MKKWLAIGGLILVTVIWGGGFVASDMALESMKPFQIMMVRFLVAWSGKSKKSRAGNQTCGCNKSRHINGNCAFYGLFIANNWSAIYNTFQECVSYSA